MSEEATLPRDCGRDMVGLLFMAAISLFLWTGLFIPMFKKFYLSELLIVVVAIGIEGAVLANAARHPESAVVRSLAFLVALALWPMIIYLIINLKRKPEER